MHVSTRMNSVCKEPELAGAIESSVAVAVAVAVVMDLKVAVFVLVLEAAVAAVIIGALNCVMLASTRTNSVCKGPGPVRVIGKRANKGFAPTPRPASIGKRRGDWLPRSQA